MQEAGQLDHMRPGGASVLQRPADAGEDGVQLLVQGAFVPRDAGQEDEAARDNIARWDDRRVVLLYGLLGGAPHGPQVYGDGTLRSGGRPGRLAPDMAMNSWRKDG